MLLMLLMALTLACSYFFILSRLYKCRVRCPPPHINN